MSDIPQISSLLQESCDLHNEKDTCLTLSSPELVKAQITIRKRYRQKLRRAKADIATAINEMQKLKREVDACDGDQAIDIEELDEYKWELIRAEKDLRNGNSATDPHIV